MVVRYYSRAELKGAVDWLPERRSLPSIEGSNFPRCRRLLKPDEYSRVFKYGQRSADNLFLVLALPNHMSLPRLGLAVSKKNCRRAVDRNRVKRVIRESFRLQQKLLQGLDIVVLSRGGVLQADNHRCFESLRVHWHKVAEACA